ncbi:hypothetical protein ASG04_16340 [Curtobacterium sp. Leaf183]|uniref:hypothetical protein n=1 Tax=Curtobacterium sp. Leaf183 TaxID=1736291 RepID=UPI0006FB542E|nr:hypothetical protein [Curtobacterium sp. Leaf183]KQS06130.1 hypothetical protein ASG04_16340 [Curtobacterium sp. Leaf183]
MTTTSLSFAGTLRSELHGTWSVPALRWLVLLAAPAAALTTIAAAHFSPGIAVASGSMVGGAVLALVGGLSIAGEYATGAVRTTVTAAPRRTALFLAKSLAVVLIGLAVGWVGGLVGAAANGILGSAALSVLATGPAVAATGLFGLFLGFLIRRVAPTAVTAVFGLFLVSGLLGGVRIGDGYLTDSLFTDSTVALVAGTPDWSQPFGTVALWLAVAGVAAAVRLRRSDV